MGKRWAAVAAALAAPLYPCSAWATQWLFVLGQKGLVEGGGAASGSAPPAGGAAEGAAPGAPTGGGWEQILFLVAIFAVFYFLIIRPQQKRSKQHREFVAALKVNDKVITNGGMYGRIVELDNATALVELDKNCRIKILRSYISARQQDDVSKDAAAMRDTSSN